MRRMLLGKKGDFFSIKTATAVLLFFFLIVSPPTGLCNKAGPQESQVDPHTPHNFTGQRGMVVAAHPLAVDAGLEMLKKGGNAVDAAISAAFALNVAEPFASGIGGGGFIVLYLARANKITVVNFREKAPSKAYPEMFLDQGEISQTKRTSHGLAVAVPGALAGWQYVLEKYGTKSRTDVMERAILIAESGFEVSKTFSRINKDEYEKLLRNSGESSPYLKEGFPYEPGDLLRNPELAETFKIIAAEGWESFYSGDLAYKIIAAVKDRGGIMIPEDLEDYKPVEVHPLKGTFRDLTLFTIPPPGTGGLHIIQLLNCIEAWPLKEWGHNSPSYIHHIGEALRLIFSDRSRYLGDPDFVSVPVQQLVSKQYAGGITSRIKPDRVLGTYPFSRLDEEQDRKENTSHLCVVDNEGNIVSLTQSINDFFGSGIIPEGTGFLLNNHMADFSTDPDSVNAARPNRRPVSSMGPFIMFRKEKPFLVLGSPGGTRIFPSLTQIILNILEFGMALDEAIEAPRFFTTSSRGKARSLSLESRIPEETIKSLQDLGHEVVIRGDFDKYFGGAQGIMLCPGKKLLLGGADSRRDGSGAGY